MKVEDEDLKLQGISIRILYDRYKGLVASVLIALFAVASALVMPPGLYSTNLEYVDFQETYTTTICTLLSTVVATILGLTLATYIFFQNELRGLVIDKPYLSSGVTRFKSTAKERMRKIVYFSTASLVLCVSIVLFVECFMGGNPLKIAKYGAFILWLVYLLLYYVGPLVGVFAIVEMIVFDWDMLNYNKELVRNANDCERGVSDHKPRTDEASLKWWRDIQTVEMLMKRIESNHQSAISAFPETDGLYIIMSSKGDEGSVSELIGDYKKLIGTRDTSIILCENNVEVDNLIKESKTLLNDVRSGVLGQFVCGEDLGRMSFEWADLSGADFSGTNFSDSNFSSASLGGSKFCNATFASCFLPNMRTSNSTPSAEGECPESYIELCDRNGVPAYFHGAQFKYAMMDGLRLSAEDVKARRVACEEARNEDAGEGEVGFSEERLDWREVIFDEARINQARFEKVTFAEAGFQDTQAFQVKANDCIFDDAGFQSAFFAGIDAQDTSFQGADFSRANLSNGNLSKCNLERANFRETNLSSTNLVNCDFKEANFKKANFTYSHIVACSFSHVYCTDVVFRSSKFEKGKSKEEVERRPVVFENSMLTNGDFTYAILGEVCFRGCLARNCAFVGCSADDTHFVNSAFEESVFSGVRMEECVFRGTLFSDAAFFACDFTKCSFEQIDFSNAAFRCDVGRVETSLEDPSQSQCFLKSHFKEVSFRNATGLEGDFFRGAVLISVDFTGTHLEKAKVIAAAERVKNCKFDLEECR